jgi:hypothetical protein
VERLKADKDFDRRFRSGYEFALKQMLLEGIDEQYPLFDAVKCAIVPSDVSNVDSASDSLICGYDFQFCIKALVAATAKAVNEQLGSRHSARFQGCGTIDDYQPYCAKSMIWETDWDAAIICAIADLGYKPLVHHWRPVMEAEVRKALHAI